MNSSAGDKTATVPHQPAHDEVISHLDASDSRMHQVVHADGKLRSALGTAVEVNP